MGHSPEDLQVTLDLSTDEEIQEDPSAARWNETLNALTSLVNTPNAITIDEAVQAINSHFVAWTMCGEDGHTPDAKLAGQYMWAFWFYLINAVVQVPDGHSAQGQLVALVKGLHDLTDPVEYMPVGRIKSQRVWADLPGLGVELREAMDDPDRYTYGLEEFTARLEQEINWGFKWMAIVKFKRALETPEPAVKLKKGIAKQPAVVRPIDPCLRHMEIWMRVAGQTLYQACQRNTKVEGDRVGNAPEPDFTLDLWNSWKSRIGEIKFDTTEPADRRESAERIETLMIAREEEEEGT
ncbi:hypothetical protein BKA70DRAFT_516962 [Coprinopsis sp. MPI-PUGE-AT-0042]|nr:hypothetical protein BKA70DRAFT_516962 [Coprinopsis sp. MPI-PUGE-AT-0042]